MDPDLVIPDQGFIYRPGAMTERSSRVVYGPISSSVVVDLEADFLLAREMREKEREEMRLRQTRGLSRNSHRKRSSATSTRARRKGVRISQVVAKPAREGGVTMSTVPVVGACVATGEGDAGLTAVIPTAEGANPALPPIAAGVPDGAKASEPHRSSSHGGTGGGDGGQAGEGHQSTKASGSSDPGHRPSHSEGDAATSLAAGAENTLAPPAKEAVPVTTQPMERPIVTRLMGLASLQGAGDGDGANGSDIALGEDATVSGRTTVRTARVLRPGVSLDKTQAGQLVVTVDGMVLGSKNMLQTHVLEEEDSDDEPAPRRNSAVGPDAHHASSTAGHGTSDEDATRELREWWEKNADKNLNAKLELSRQQVLRDKRKEAAEAALVQARASKVAAQKLKEKQERDENERRLQVTWTLVCSLCLGVHRGHIVSSVSLWLCVCVSTPCDSSCART